MHVSEGDDEFSIGTFILILAVVIVLLFCRAVNRLPASFEYGDPLSLN